MLAVFRAFQGLGAAAAMPSAVRASCRLSLPILIPSVSQFGILAHSFHVGTRGRTIALTTFAAGAPVGGAFGNVLGGTVTQLSEYVFPTSHLLMALIHVQPTLEDHVLACCWPFRIGFARRIGFDPTGRTR